MFPVEVFSFDCVWIFYVHFFFIVDSWIKLSVFIIEKVLKTFLFILYWTSIIFARTFILNFYLLFFSPHSYRFNESLLIVYFTHFFLFFSMYFLSSFHLFMCIFCIICCRYAFIFTISLDYCFSCGGHIHTNTHEHHRPFDFSIRFWEQRFCQLHNWRLRRLFRITRQLKSIDDTHTANNKHCNWWKRNAFIEQIYTHTYCQHPSTLASTHDSMKNQFRNVHGQTSTHSQIYITFEFHDTHETTNTQTPTKQNHTKPKTKILLK